MELFCGYDHSYETRVHANHLDNQSSINPHILSFGWLLWLKIKMCFGHTTTFKVDEPYCCKSRCVDFNLSDG